MIEIRCRACGAEVFYEEVDRLVCCDYCGESSLLLDDTLEQVEDHRTLDVRFDDSRLSEACRLLYFPFWVVEGSFTTPFDSGDIRESVWGAERRVSNGSVVDETRVQVPALATEKELGLLLEAMPEVQLGGRISLPVGDTREFRQSDAEAGEVLHGTMVAAEALEKARKTVELAHREAIVSRHQENQIKTTRLAQETVYLLHRPFWVGANTLVDAHTGKRLEDCRVPYPEAVTSVTHDDFSRRRRQLGTTVTMLALVPAGLGLYASRLDPGSPFEVYLNVLGALMLLIGWRLYEMAFAPPRLFLEENPQLYRANLLSFYNGAGCFGSALFLVLFGLCLVPEIGPLALLFPLLALIDPFINWVNRNATGVSRNPLTLPLRLLKLIFGSLSRLLVFGFFSFVCLVYLILIFLS